MPIDEKLFTKLSINPPESSWIVTNWRRQGKVFLLLEQIFFLDYLGQTHCITLKEWLEECKKQDKEDLIVRSSRGGEEPFRKDRTDFSRRKKFIGRGSVDRRGRTKFVRTRKAAPVKLKR